MTFTLGIAALGGPDKQFKTCSSKEPSSSAFPAPPHKVGLAALPDSLAHYILSLGLPLMPTLTSSSPGQNPTHIFPHLPAAPPLVFSPSLHTPKCHQYLPSRASQKPRGHPSLLIHQQGLVDLTS